MVIGGISVFADGNALYARRVADGRAVWHRAFPNQSNTLTAGITGTVDGLWAWKGAAVALLGEGSATPTLVSVSASGAVRYRVKLDNAKVPQGYSAIIRDPAVTATVSWPMSPTATRSRPSTCRRASSCGLARTARTRASSPRATC